ncbi:cation-transporting P-type ATPase, partial [Turicibacter sanguinis]
MTVIKPLAKEANHNHQRNINVKTGLTEEQVLEQRKQYGTNEFSKPSERGLLK